MHYLGGQRVNDSVKKRNAGSLCYYQGMTKEYHRMTVVRRMAVREALNPVNASWLPENGLARTGVLSLK
jgi:hypothetical protein